MNLMVRTCCSSNDYTLFSLQGLTGGSIDFGTPARNSALL